MADDKRAALIAGLRQAIEKSYATGAAKIAASARRMAPVLKRPTARRTVGNLRSAIGVERPPVGEGRIKVRVGVDPTIAPYARFQEAGFRVRGRKGGPADRFLPGARFMRDAFLAYRDNIINDVDRKVGEQLDKVNNS